MPAPAIRELSRRTVYGLVVEVIKVGVIWLWPIIVPGLAILAGYLGGVAWLYVIVAASVIFGAGATGALRFSELRARITPINKLAFNLVTLAADFTKDKRTGQIRSIEKAQICFQLQNAAHFQIGYVIDELHTSFEGMINTKPEKIRTIDVPPGGLVVYRDTPIDTKSMTLDKASYEGNLKFKIRYGYPGNEVHVIQRNLMLTFVIDNKTGSVSITFWDAVETDVPTR